MVGVDESEDLVVVADSLGLSDGSLSEAAAVVVGVAVAGRKVDAGDAGVLIGPFCEIVGTATWLTGVSAIGGSYCPRRSP